MTTQYDIFISYRRDAFESANLFATRLKALGYRVFFDLETMNAGKFNEQLLDVISKCKDFILILSPNALERCSDEGDWVRRETLCAMEHKKNIIPVMLSGFVWPTEMPQGMEELCNYQALAPAPNTLFDLQVKRLTGYLKSKAYAQIRKRWMIGICITAAIIALMLILGHLSYLPAAERLGESLTLRSSFMLELKKINMSTYSSWEQFISDYSDQSKTKEDKTDALILFNRILDIQEKAAQQLYKGILEQQISISKFHLPLFAMHGIDIPDLLIINTYTRNCFDDFFAMLDTYKIAIEDKPTYNVVQLSVKASAEYINCSINMYYYSYLQMMSHLPEQARDQYYKVSSTWVEFPNVGLDLPDKEYERLIGFETEKNMQQIKYLDLVMTQTEMELEVINKKLDTLNVAATEMESYKDTMNIVNQWLLQQLQQQNE